MSKLIANDAARNALDVWKQIIQRLHLALGAADGKLGAGALNQVIEIEENFGFRVDGCFGRVEIFWPGFFVSRKCPPGESDDFSGLAGNRKHHPVAELGVHVNRRTILSAPTLVIPTEGRNLLFLRSAVRRLTADG